MYLPKLHEQTDLAELHGLMRAHPLGTWATQGNGELIVNHVPFILDSAAGPYGTLLCHVARANPVWQDFSKSVESVIVFHGPDAYISPAWYPSKSLHGKVVPTWNYTVVHAHGMPVVVTQGDALRDHLARLTATHEGELASAWKISDAPEDFIAHMMKQIVGIRIPISRIVGKWKVSQNRSPADRQGVVAVLTAKTEPKLKEMARLVDRG
jgi:transcriptional regulator